MEAFTLYPKKIHIIRIDPGEDVLLEIGAFARKADIRQAVVTGGYGTLVSHSLHWVTHNRIPTDNSFGKGEGGIEILSMNGMVVEHEPHIHVTLSTENGAYGGHMEPGCRAYVICEVFLVEVEGIDLRRVRVPVDIPGMGKGSVSRLKADRGEK
jgi:predicted DNA-binding protein with PD1-like motif